MFLKALLTKPNLQSAKYDHATKYFSHIDAAIFVVILHIVCLKNIFHLKTHIYSSSEQKKRLLKEKASYPRNDKNYLCRKI